MIKIIIGVDDTDDISKITSTGTIAELIAKQAQLQGATIQFGITRHQLLLHRDIAYTSHNSSMCFAADISAEEIPWLWSSAKAIVKKNMAKTADPGLCLCRLDQLKNQEALIAYGLQAKRVVLQKESAYQLANSTEGVWLEELGGDGLGIIGALAGVGLRLGGSDGTFRGKAKLKEEESLLPASLMKERLNISEIINQEGERVSDNTRVLLNKFAKIAYLQHKKMAIVKKNPQGIYQLCNKDDLYDGIQRIGNWEKICEHFSFDNDCNESDHSDEETCINCLFRKWSSTGFYCQLKQE